MKKLLNSVVSMVPLVVLVLLTWGVSSVLAAQAASSKNMELVGTNDLQARSTYQPTVHRYPGDRYILFAGHHALGTNPVTGQPLPSFNPLTGKNELNGTSLVDVTDPKHPKLLFHIPVSDGASGGAQMVRVCDGSTLPIGNTKVYMLRTYAGSAHEIWDVTDPSKPVGVRTVAGGNPVIGAQTGADRGPADKFMSLRANAPISVWPRVRGPSAADGGRRRHERSLPSHDARRVRDYTLARSSCTTPACVRRPTRPSAR